MGWTDYDPQRSLLVSLNLHGVVRFRFPTNGNRWQLDERKLLEYTTRKQPLSANSFSVVELGVSEYSFPPVVLRKIRTAAGRTFFRLPSCLRIFSPDRTEDFPSCLAK